MNIYTQSVARITEHLLQGINDKMWTYKEYDFSAIYMDTWKT